MYQYLMQFFYAFIIYCSLLTVSEQKFLISFFIIFLDYNFMILHAEKLIIQKDSYVYNDQAWNKTAGFTKT